MSAVNIEEYTIKTNDATLALSFHDENESLVADLATYIQPIFMYVDNSVPGATPTRTWIKAALCEEVMSDAYETSQGLRD